MMWPLIGKFGHTWRRLRFLGSERRRRWRAAEKAQIVAESLAPEARVSEVARRHAVHPNQLHAWRRQVRTAVPAVAPDGRPRFVPVAIAPGHSVAAGAGTEAAIEVVLRNGRVLRLPASVAPARAAALADALEGLAR